VARTACDRVTRAVIFDLDGVIVDSREAITTCLNHALREGGHPERPASDLYRHIGPALADAFGELLELPRDDEAVVSCVAAYRRIYATESLRLTKLIPGMAEVLGRLDARKGIASSKPIAFSEPILEQLGIRHHFEVVAGPDLNPFGETKTTTIATALETLGRPAVMVGDRRHDVEGAHANGIPCVGVTWGIGTRAELKTAGAELLVERPHELPAAIDGIERGRS
jgi:phosphoglycolate phosphatase